MVHSHVFVSVGSFWSRTGVSPDFWFYRLSVHTRLCFEGLEALISALLMGNRFSCCQGEILFHDSWISKRCCHSKYWCQPEILEGSYCGQSLTRLTASIHRSKGKRVDSQATMLGQRTMNQKNKGHWVTPRLAQRYPTRVTVTFGSRRTITLHFLLTATPLLAGE